MSDIISDAFKEGAKETDRLRAENKRLENANNIFKGVISSNKIEREHLEHILAAKDKVIKAWERTVREVSGLAGFDYNSRVPKIFKHELEGLDKGDDG